MADTASPDPPEPERVRAARAWRDETAGRYGPGARCSWENDLEVNNRAWWGDVNALLQYVDQLAPPEPDPVAEAAEAERPTVVDLMAALEASLAAVRHAEPAG